MSLNFPSNPTNGEVYDIYVYDSTRSAWILNDTFNLPDQIAVLESQIVAPIDLNLNTISSNYSIPQGYNGVSAGPITIVSGVTVTIPDGSSWSIV